MLNYLQCFPDGPRWLLIKVAIQIMLLLCSKSCRGSPVPSRIEPLIPQVGPAPALASTHTPLPSAPAAPTSLPQACLPPEPLFTQSPLLVQPSLGCLLLATFSTPAVRLKCHLPPATPACRYSQLSFVPHFPVFPICLRRSPSSESPVWFVTAVCPGSRAILGWDRALWTRPQVLPVIATRGRLQVRNQT